MEEPNDVQYLGFKRQDWLLLVCDIIFFYFMLFWPAIKTLVVVRNPKKFVGRWSTYWIGLPSFLVLYYIARLLLKRTILFPFLEVVLGVVCSYNHGSIIQKFAVIVVSPRFKKNYTFLKSLPEKIDLWKFIQLPVEFLMSASFRRKREQPSDDEESD